MAKVASVNINLSSDIGYAIYELQTLLLANGWTLYQNGGGSVTGGRSGTVINTSGSLWASGTNTWAILTRGSLWITIWRVGSTSLTVKFAVAAPTSAGNATTPDSQATSANEVAYSTMSVTSASRAHAVTFDADCNANGVRSFYLLFTDGSTTLRGSVVLEALADGTYAASNPAPYVVAAHGGGYPFYTGGAVWAWWYSPGSAWTSSNNFAVPYGANYVAGASVGCGPDPWDGRDIGIPVCWARPTSGARPGFVGQSSHMRAACVVRGYPSTVSLATDAYVYASAGSSGACLVPWPDAVTPL